MGTTRRVVVMSLVAVGMVGCGTESPRKQVASLGEATLEQCPGGGVIVQVGEDDNGNGTLDAAEVDSTQPVCNGKDGANGKDGVDGLNGQDGVAGKDGANGTSTHISEYYRCSVFFGGIPLGLEYTQALFSSGDVMVTGAVLGSAVLGSDVETGAAVYQAGTLGAATGAIVLHHDYYGTASGGFWLLSLDRPSMVLTTRYEDSEYPGGFFTSPQPASNCTKIVVP